MAKQKNASAAAWLESRADRPKITVDALVDLPGIDKLDLKVLSDETVVLNSEKAAAYIELPVFSGERPVTDSHVQFLYDEMMKGNFNPLLVILSSCEFAGVVYKINGQHTCWAKFYAEGYEPKVREIRYKVQTAEQLRLLYATYDRNKARTDNHITMIELANDPHIKSIPVRIMNLLASAIRFWMFESTRDRGRCRPQDLASLIKNKYLTLCLSVSNFMTANVNSTSEMGFIRRRAVVAAMLETFNKIPTKAHEFWKPVCDGIGLDSKTDPRWQLREFLKHAVIHSSSARGTRSVSEDEMYNHCIPAFNKWRKGEQVKCLRATNERVRAI